MEEQPIFQDPKAETKQPISFPNRSYINSQDINARFADIMREVYVKRLVIKKSNKPNHLEISVLDGIVVNFKGIRFDLGKLPPKLLKVPKMEVKKYLRLSIDYDDTIPRNIEFMINVYHLESLSDVRGTSDDESKRETMLATFLSHKDKNFDFELVQELKDYEIKFNTDHKDMDLNLPFEANIMEEKEIKISDYDKNGIPKKIVRVLKDGTLLTSILSNPNSNGRYLKVTTITSNPNKTDFQEKKYEWALTYDNNNNITSIKNIFYGGA